MNIWFGFSSLVLDLNSFFASCEQEEEPELRGQPIAVVPVEAETTCAIAASYAAKAFGIQTGTPIWEARKLCPGLITVKARPRLYVDYHNLIIKAIETCLPIEKIMSIDEFSCRLDRTQRSPDAARALALRIKQAIKLQVGECLTSSIGIAANVLLAKLASNMQKPDGLVLLDTADLPDAIAHLPLKALPGVGRNMVARLNRCGIHDMRAIYAADSAFLRRVWNGVTGARMHTLLHGGDIATAAHPKRSIGHQHVLAPKERRIDLATPVIRQLLARAAQRLRIEQVYCRYLAIDIKWAWTEGEDAYYSDGQTVQETQDTALLLKVMMSLWRQVPPLAPLRVGVMLLDLVPATRHQPDLFDRPRPVNLIAAVDNLNSRFGRGTVDYGAGLPALTSKIAFQRVPRVEEF